MEIRRTVPVKLDMDESSAALLHRTIDEFLWAANYVVEAAWVGDYKETSRIALHELTYHDVREETGLQANLVQAARNKAATAIKSTVAQWRQGTAAGKPHFSAPTVAYDKRSATIHNDHATLATVEERVTVDFVLPDENRDTPHSAYLFNDAYEVTGGELHYRSADDEFYLHIRMKADVEFDDTGQDTPENRTVLGVDLGIENIAVASTGRFWNGGELNHWHREYENRRGSLQRCGSRWAHEAVQRISQKETGYCRHILHTISKEIVDEAIDYGCSVIAFEDLTNIRDRFPDSKKFHNWAFRRLYEYVEYKAEKYGIEAVQVDPRYTSQRCSRCGFTHESNREYRNGQSEFCCQDCCYEVHADYNAAKNVGHTYLRDQHTSDGGGALVGVRLNSGTMTANGEFLPADVVRPEQESMLNTTE